MPPFTTWLHWLPPPTHLHTLLGPTPSLPSRQHRCGGADRDRTGDPLLAKQVLSQLSYSPNEMVGLVGVEPTTPRLSSVCSNQLSYRPS